MFEKLENNSGKICLVLIGATITGGAILVFGAPAFATAYVSLHVVELLTVSSAVGALASGGSYIRRESINRNAREQSNSRQEEIRRSQIISDGINMEQRTGRSGDLERQTDERISATEADINSLRSEVRRLNGMYRNLSKSFALQTIEEERRRYEAGDYSDSDSSTEESKQPLLSERNMFQRPVTRTSMEIASQQYTNGVVHRRRMGNSSN